MHPVQRPHLRLLVAELCVPLLLVGVLDLGFARYVARTADMPVPQLFGPLPITAGKFLALRERAADHRALDVLFFGMSPMMRINGQQLEADLSTRLRRPVRTFNFAGPYHTFAFDQRLLRDIVMPLATPAVVIYGVTPLALVNESVPTSQIEAHADTLPVFGLYTGPPAARLRALLTMHLTLLEYREVIRDALQVPIGWKRPPFAVQSRAADPAGDIPLLTEHKAVVGLHMLEREQQRRFVRFDALLNDSLLFDHLAQFAQFCRAHGIALVLLNNPVHPLFMEILPNGRQDYDRYLARLRQVAAELQVRLFEPTPDGVGPPDLYQDTVHHDPAGGAWLTAEIERYLVDNGLVKAD